jgi:hypothetical protein
MAWACLGWRGHGRLEFLKPGEMMNNVRYCQVLEDKLELFMTQHNSTHFFQDGAPCHRSKVVTNWFVEKPHIQLIKWQGDSPDLNPIENASAWMKMQLRESHPTNLDQLREEVKRLWVLRMEDSQILRSLVESMPKRLLEVIERGGNTVRYRKHVCYVL